MIRDYAIGFAMVLALSVNGWGCSGAEQASEVGEDIEPEPVVSVELVPDITDPVEDAENVRKTFEGMSTISDDSPLRFDDLPDPPPEDGPTGLLEKNGGVSIGVGWPMKGHLVYQDGVRDSQQVPPDACATWGLECDDEWHIQARVNSFSGAAGADAIAAAEFKGGNCGQNNTNGWYPCALPFLTGGLDSIGRTLKWRILDTNCGTVVQKEHLRAGIISALSYYDTHIGVNFAETAGADWNVLFTCGAWPATQSETIARWFPRGNLPLHGALATADGTPVGVDTCEQTGLPGSTNPRRRFAASLDMMYSYNQGEININSGSLWPALNCPAASTSAKIRNGVRSLIMHELGHHFGLQHTPEYNDPIKGLLYPGFPTCTNAVTNVMAFPADYDWAMKDTKFDPNKFIDVYDEDLSCYVPSVN